MKFKKYFLFFASLTVMFFAIPESFAKAKNYYADMDIVVRRDSDPSKVFTIPKGTKISCKSAASRNCSFEYKFIGKYADEHTRKKTGKKITETHGIKLSKKYFTTVSPESKPLRENRASKTIQQKKATPAELRNQKRAERKKQRTSNQTTFGGRDGDELAGGQTQRATRNSSRLKSKFAACYARKKKTYTSQGARKNRKGQWYLSGRKSSSRSLALCYKFAKHLLSGCGATKYWSSKYAKDAGPHLLRQGFKKLNIKDPSKAPKGSVIVYGNSCRSTNRAGHIEVKVGKKEYVSDYIANKPRSAETKCRPVTGIYFK